MPLPHYEVDVPIHHASIPDASGVHVFIGLADSPTAALRCAREAYDAALAAQLAGEQLVGRQAGEWGAHGLRSGWELEWPAATTSRWHNPNNLLK